VIETAGYAPGQDGDSVESAVPIARRDRVFELARTIEDVGDISFTRPPKRARQRYLVRYTALVAVLTGLVGLAHVMTGSIPLWYGTAALVVCVPAAAQLKWKNIGYHHGANYIVARSGFWTRRTTIVPYYRIQTVADSQTIFQRRRNLGTLVVDTATSGGFWGGDAVVLDIDAETARSLREEVQESFQSSIARRNTRL
jgi:putative membrane protein